MSGRTASASFRRLVFGLALACALGGCKGGLYGLLGQGTQGGSAALRLPAPKPDAAAASSGPAGRPSQGPAMSSDVPKSGMVASWLTTGDQARLLQRQPDVPLTVLPRTLTPWSPGVESAGPLPASAPAITIETGPAARRQQMSGFGAALSASSAWLLAEKLDTARRRALLAELFGPAPGIGLSAARLPLGANEFARSQYSYDDLPPGVTDDGLARFSIDPDRPYLLPLIQDALAFNPELELIASPSSAPAWMKTSGSLLQGTLKPEAYGAYARYLKRYADVYLEEGIPIRAITLQSDPGGPADGPADMPAMRLDDAARAQLIGKHLGPLLEDEGPLILEWDGNRDAPQSPLKVLQDKIAGPYVAGVAWHCYAGDAETQGSVAAAHPGKDSYLTECSGGAWAPGWRDNLAHFARTLVQAATRGAARGILFGNLALDERGGPRIGGCRGCRGVVTVGEGGAVTRNPEYYALAHASRFVRPGAWRLATGGGTDGVDSAAFENPDGTLVLVAVNSAGEARTVAVRAGKLGYSATLPPASVATYFWRPQP